MSSTPDPAAPVAAAKSPSPPDLSGIEQAITTLTTFLKHGQATVDQRPFTTDQLAIEEDFRALVRGLGRPRPEDRPGRFRWRVLRAEYLELTKPLPVEATEIGAYGADRSELWRIGVSKNSGGNRQVFRHSDITATGVLRLRALDVNGQTLLVGLPAPATRAHSTPAGY
jgi:hypothetical protein